MIRLEGRGLVKRTRHSATDVSVCLTPAGFELIADAAPRILSLVDPLFWTQMSAGKRDSLGAICDKFIEAESTNC